MFTVLCVNVSRGGTFYDKVMAHAEEPEEDLSSAQGTGWAYFSQAGALSPHGCIKNISQPIFASNNKFATGPCCDAARATTHIVTIGFCSSGGVGVDDAQRSTEVPSRLHHAVRVGEGGMRFRCHQVVVWGLPSHR